MDNLFKYKNNIMKTNFSVALTLIFWLFLITPIFAYVGPVAYLTEQNYNTVIINHLFLINIFIYLWIIYLNIKTIL